MLIQIIIHNIKIIFLIIFIVLLFTNGFLKQIIKKEIYFDNKIGYDREDNIDFSGYSSTVKPIALFDVDNNIVKSNDFQINNNNIINELIKIFNLAINHGIYGFAFYYQYNFDRKFLYDPLNIIIQNKDLKIHYFIIFDNNKMSNDKMEINISKIFEDIRKYILDERYIKFDNKYVIGLNNYNSSKNTSLILRNKFKENKLGEIFILSRTYYYNHTKDKSNINDGFYYSPLYDSIKKVEFIYNNTYNYFYINLIYHHLLLPDLKKNRVYRISEVMNEYPIFINGTKTLFWDYSPDKFFILNKVIINWTKANYEKDNQYIFINNFNSFLKDNILGYANINALSKALYDLPFISDDTTKFNISKLIKSVLVLIQIHLYYVNLLREIIDKINNMPVPIDLFITTDTEQKKIFIKNYLKDNSKANKIEILITPNKGRDVIPCLIQLKDIIMY